MRTTAVAAPEPNGPWEIVEVTTESIISILLETPLNGNHLAVVCKGSEATAVFCFLSTNGTIELEDSINAEMALRIANERYPEGI